MRYKWVLILLVLGGISASAAERPAVRGFSVPAETTVPITYCMHYMPANGLPGYEEQSLLDSLQSSPPDLFHIFYNIPFKGGLGPTYGCELFTDAILPPDQVPREIERIQSNIRKLRATGVERLIPYVYTTAFFGHPEKRTGFFNYYDHWDEYRRFGLGPKPATDPTLWSQINGPRPLGGGPPDALHYEPCINHPAWSQHLDLVVRQIAEVGYDGMFFDVNALYCICPHCQEKFDIYLLDKYGREGLREAFGANDHRTLNISPIVRDFERTILEASSRYQADIRDGKDRQRVTGVPSSMQGKLEEGEFLLRCYMQDSLGEYPPRGNFREYLINRFGTEDVAAVPQAEKDLFQQTVLRHEFREFLESPELAELLESRFGSSDVKRRARTRPRDLLLWVETQRFRTQCIAHMFARLKRVGRTSFAEQGRGDDFYTVANVGTMFSLDSLNKRRVYAIDLAGWAPMVDLQLFEEMNQPGSLESGVIISNIFAFRWAMAAGARAGTLVYKVSDDRTADLAEAEAAAGGGGAFIQPGTGAPESRKRWKRFFAENSELWDGGRSCARVGLLFWSDQVYYEHPEHLAMVHRLIRVFSETQVPFDIVTEEAAHRVAEYEFLIVPMLRYLDSSQIETLTDYAHRGGNLVVVEPFGTEDKFARPRQADPLAKVGVSTGDLQCKDWGKGKILRLDPEQIPERQSDLWCLMEERSNAFVRARDFANEARWADLKSGVDLGAQFVNRLEESLEIRLRWCPPTTDAGVYIHPYRVPPKPGRPDRLVIHALNYRLPIILANEGKISDPVWSPSTKSGEAVVARDVRISVPLPPATKVKRVDALSPTDGVAPWTSSGHGSVQWKIESNRLILTIARLRIYQAVVVELET